MDSPRVELPHEITRGWLEHEGLRLPSESEWKWAMKGGASTRFSFGDSVDDDYVWSARNSMICSCRGCEGRASMGVPHYCTSTSADRAPRLRSTRDHAGKHNAFGLVDMAGNVWEFLADARVVGGSFEEPADTITGRPIVALDRSTLSCVGFRAFAVVPMEITCP